MMRFPRGMTIDMRRFICALLSGSLCGSLGPARAESFTQLDLTKIVKASQSNELRFEKVYRGQTFGATMKIDRISKPMFGAKIALIMKSSEGKAVCYLDDDRVIERLAMNDVGSPVGVTGTINDTVLGTLMLRDCRLTF
jgi:hypothetical protein